MFSVLVDEAALPLTGPVSEVFTEVAACSHRHSVSGGAALHKALAALTATIRKQEGYVMNLCCGEDATGGVGARMAALLLEQCGLSYTGCRAALLRRSLDELLMMVWYASIPMTAFAVVASEEDAEAVLRHLRPPLLVRSALPFASTCCQRLPPELCQPSSMRDLFQEHGRLIVSEDTDNLADGPSTGHPVVVATVLVCGGNSRGAVAIAFDGGSVPEQSTQEEKLRAWAAAFSRDVLEHCGVACLVFHGEGRRSASSDEAEPSTLEWCLNDVELNPSLSRLVTAFPNSLDSGAVLRDMAVDARAAHTRPNYEVHLNEDSRKGYSLRTTRAIKKGEVIFEDECRSFAVVTRPHVERTWNPEQKKTFTEYAWPLDSEGHLYAIWEKEPSRWRPINHSCNPTCIFAAPHSLNVIACRDLAPGEELSMDYATFCDNTMRPFDCLCGADCCRGRIIPDEAALRKYGENTWLRKVPPPVKPLV